MKKNLCYASNACRKGDNMSGLRQKPRDVLNDLMKQLYEGWEVIDEEAKYEKKYYEQCEVLSGFSTLYPRVLYTVYSDKAKNLGEELHNWRQLYEHVEEKLTELIELMVLGLELRMIDMLANLPYEQRSVVVGLIIVGPDKDKDIKYETKLSNEIEMTYENLRQIRKIFEATPPGHCVVGIMPEGEGCFKEGKGVFLKGYAKDFPPFCFKIQFMAKNFWRLSVQYKTCEKIIFEKRSGLYRFPINMGDNVFRDVKKLLEEQLTCSSDDKKIKTIDTIKKIIEAGCEQKHGTVLVFGEKAIIEEESKRLLEAMRGIGIEIPKTKNLELEYIKGHTAIDGAMLFDVEKGCCHAMGIILDGEAVEGDPSRGARYNSTLAYIESVKKRHRQNSKNPMIFAIVISEDRYVNLVK
ncbi:MAG: hypothetical protein ACOYI7_05335 [Candidatus Excrementavichristensenella sp.]